jgi:hypothetical protein
MPKFNFENLLKIMLPAFIVLGVTELTSYYYQFNVPILDYLDFTEIINVFLSNIPTYGMILYPFVALVIIMEGTDFEAIVLLIGFALFSIFSFINADLMLVARFIISVVFNISYIALGLIFKSKLREIYSKFKTGYVLWVAFLIIFIINIAIISISGVLYAHEVKSRHLYKGSSVSINGVDIVSNDTCYFIGKTHEYIFFYNEKTESPVIYPIEKVDKIIYKLGINR